MKERDSFVFRDANLQNWHQRTFTGLCSLSSCIMVARKPVQLYSRPPADLLHSSLLYLERGPFRIFSASFSYFPGAGLAHAHREAAPRQRAQTSEGHCGHRGVTARSGGQIRNKGEAERARASSPGWDERQDPIFTPYRTNKISVVQTRSEGLHDSRSLLFGQTRRKLITSDLLTVPSSMASSKCRHCCWKGAMRVILTVNVSLSNCVTVTSLP